MVFKERLDVPWSGCQGGVQVGLDLGGLFQPNQLCDSVMVLI